VPLPLPKCYTLSHAFWISFIWRLAVADLPIPTFQEHAMRVMMRSVVTAVIAGTAAVMVLPSQAGGNKEIKEQMIKTHRGDKSPLATLVRQIQSDKIDWKETKDSVAKIRELGDLLAKEKKGGGSAGYTKAVAALQDAVYNKDQEAVAAAHKLLMKTCNACHYGGPPSLKDKELP
jgi:hypothetical protein